MAVSPTSATLKLIGDTTQLTAKITPSDTTENISWSSSNTSVATVDSNGKVTAKKSGTATITVKSSSGKKSATSTIKVIGIEVTGTTASAKVSIHTRSVTKTKKEREHTADCDGDGKDDGVQHSDGCHEGEKETTDTYEVTYNVYDYTGVHISFYINSDIDTSKLSLTKSSIDGKSESGRSSGGYSWNSKNMTSEEKHNSYTASGYGRRLKDEDGNELDGTATYPSYDVGVSDLSLENVKFCTDYKERTNNSTQSTTSRGYDILDSLFNFGSDCSTTVGCTSKYQFSFGNKGTEDYCDYEEVKSDRKYYWNTSSDDEVTYKSTKCYECTNYDTSKKIGSFTFRSNNYGNTGKYTEKISLKYDGTTIYTWTITY